MELEHLLFKVSTVHVVQSTWQGGLQVALKLWVCAFFHVTFSSGLQETTVPSKTDVSTVPSKTDERSCKKTRLRKGYGTQRCLECRRPTIWNLSNVPKKQHVQVSQCQFINYEITLILFTLQSERFGTLPQQLRSCIPTKH